MTLGTRGVFKLSDLVNLTDLNLWSTSCDVWIYPPLSDPFRLCDLAAATPLYSYFGGGRAGSPIQ